MALKNKTPYQVAALEALLYTGAVICGSVAGGALVAGLFIVSAWHQALLPSQPVGTLYLPILAGAFIIFALLAIFYTRALTAKRARLPRHGIGTVLLTMGLVGTYIFLGGLVPIDGRVHWRFLAECGLLIALFQGAVAYFKVKPRPHIVMTCSSVNTILIFGGVVSFVRPYYVTMMLVFLAADFLITAGKMFHKVRSHRASSLEK